MSAARTKHARERDIFCGRYGIVIFCMEFPSNKQKNDGLRDLFG